MKKLKSKYSKKSQSGIIVVILLILICIAAIFILWRLVFPISQNASEEAKIRQELTSTRIGINGVTGDLANPEGGKLGITLSRGSEPVKLKNITYTPRTVTTTTGYIPNVSIVSAIDISDSMLNKVCNVSGPTCFINQANCNLCGGKWVTKLNLTKRANIKFIDNVFNKNIDNDMAIVGYADTVYRGYCGPWGCNSLTKDNASLKDKIYSYTDTIYGTNGCQGLNKSIYILNTSKNDLKFIILMSDGMMNTYCRRDSFNSINYPFPNEKAETIQQAVIANNSNITIYAIGFGRRGELDTRGHPFLDEETLKKIANATTKGAYYFADVSQLDVVYDQILEEINTIVENETQAYYEPVNKYDFIRVIIYNESNSYKYDSKDMPNPLETKDITIETGGMTNINKIEIYLVVKTESGKEISELVATWTPGNEENTDYLPSY